MLDRNIMGTLGLSVVTERNSSAALLHLMQSCNHTCWCLAARYKSNSKQRPVIMVRRLLREAFSPAFRSGEVRCIGERIGLCVARPQAS